MSTKTQTQTSTTTTIRLQNKRLEGVQSTDDLRQLVRDVRSLGTAAGGSSNTTTNASTLSSLSSLLYQQANPPLAPEQAMEIVKDYDTTSDIVPIKVLCAMETLCAKKKGDFVKRLENCLHSTQLAFTRPPKESPETEERRKFRLRMEKLKLKQEESRYGGLVKNVGTQAQPDDVTTRSMTYAASIGLNMIIAPLSFGCFMYFFAGGLFNYMGWDTDRPAHMGPDIRKVRFSLKKRNTAS